MHHTPAMLLLATLSIVGTLPAHAAQIVLPGGSAATEGAVDILGPLANRDLTFQWSFAASQVAGLSQGSAVTAIGFRLNGGQPARPGIDVVYSAWDLEVSTSVHSPGSLAPDFADNIGPDAVTVRSGALTLPAGSIPGGETPNPFLFITFAQPYKYRGGDILFTLRQNAVSGGPLFSVDAVDLLAGVVDSVRAENADAQSGRQGFFNAPVTALQFTPVPEPGSALLVSGAVLLAGAARLIRRT